MSTTTPPSPDGHVSPAEAFDRLIWHNPRVCNGCFEHVKDVDEARLDRRAEPLDVQDHHRTARATLEQDVDSRDPCPTAQGQAMYGEIQRGVPKTTCRSCSRIGCWAESETLSKIQALRLTTPLIERLREAGVAVDERILRKTVRAGKERDTLQGYDTELFRRAVKLSVRKARRS
jgi:ArsR family metal-binding transcriptional regulator